MVDRIQNLRSRGAEPSVIKSNLASLAMKARGNPDIAKQKAWAQRAMDIVNRRIAFPHSFEGLPVTLAALKVAESKISGRMVALLRSMNEGTSEKFVDAVIEDAEQLDEVLGTIRKMLAKRKEKGLRTAARKGMDKAASMSPAEKEKARGKYLAKKMSKMKKSGDLNMRQREAGVGMARRRAAGKPW